MPSLENLLSPETTEKLSISGFEGPEKLLEIWFKPTYHCDSNSTNTNLFDDSSSGSSDSETPFKLKTGLRRISQANWQLVLNHVKCQILSVTQNKHFDAYLLSESSLFVYPERIILKTCGTTTLLHALPRILEIAASCSLHEINTVFYSRKAFMFPEKQIYPHGRWHDETSYLDKYFSESKFNRSSHVLGNIDGDHWCFYMCNSIDEIWSPIKDSIEDDVTLEILMTELDPAVMKNFWKTFTLKNSSEVSNENHGLNSLGISEIYPNSTIDDYLFDPCGYSLNGLLGPYYYTIHVTPESHCSYASFETSIPVKQFYHNHIKELGTEFNQFEDVVEKVINLFKPGKFSTTLFTRKSVGIRHEIKPSNLLSNDIEGFDCLDRQLPRELWYSIISYIDDIDISILSKCNAFFKDICNDPIVWLKLKRQVHIPRLSNRLKSSCRPTREELVKKSILRSFGDTRSLTRQISQGEYINGSNNSGLFDAQRKLEKRIKHAALETKLMKRKSIRQDLFIDAHAILLSKSGYNACILPIQLELHRQFRDIKLRKRLMARPKFDLVAGKSLGFNNATIASMICPSIKSKIKYFENKDIL